MSIWLYSLLCLIVSVNSFIPYRPFLIQHEYKNGIYGRKIRHKESVDSSSSLFVPRTDKQAEYVNSLLNHNHSLVVGIGPAGCGKTMFACHAAIHSLKAGLISKIVVTRPFVSVDQESMGFLPGSIDQKMSPWTRPIFDIFEMFFTKKEIDSMLEESVIEMAPLAYMRGRTFRNTWIIADEMQNSSPNQMVMLLTRVGEGSRIVVTGDLDQSDLGKGNGLVDFLRLVKKRLYVDSGIWIVEMGMGDVQRSAFVRTILSIYSDDKDDCGLVSNSSNVPLVSNSSNVPLVSIPSLPIDTSSKKTSITDDCALIPKKYYREII